MACHLATGQLELTPGGEVGRSQPLLLSLLALPALRSVWKFPACRHPSPEGGRSREQDHSPHLAAIDLFTCGWREPDGKLMGL